MKKLIALFVLLFSFVGNTQILDPVKWTTKIVQKSDTEFELVMDATIDANWHLYSQFTPDGGAQQLVFTFKGSGKDYKLVGKTKEGAYKKTYNDIFEVDEYYFSNKAHFVQLIKIINPNLKEIQVLLEGQSCIEGKCIQEEDNLTFKLPIIKVVEEVIKGESNEEIISTEIATIEIDSAIAKGDIKLKKIDNATAEVVTSDKPVDEEKKGLLSIFILAFLGGFAALLTPCVFPMIPMTVSFFTKQSKTKAAGIRNAFIYGFSIVVIYLLLGILVSVVFGADALNALSTNVWFNIIFFILLLVFAASFLGAFEIMLPNKWANKVDSQADRGGLLGIFFMALALAIVSFSCTGPIVGTLLVQAAAGGSQIGPIIGMLGFSLAIALPFTLFAMFPGWMNSLPKSGGWLNTVKVSLGFLELALAFKFLSNADLVLQAHWLERELFLAIWIAIFGAWAIYLFGKITLPHDSPLTHISVGRLFLAVTVTIFTIYLIPGLWGAPLKLISGFPPPMTYSESPYGVGNSQGGVEFTSVLPEHAHYGPHKIIAFHDYEQGLAYAKEVGKPILLDFTGHACVNCRKMEENVWSQNEVLSILKNDVVLISLYVDDKRPLPEEDKYTSPETGKEIKTIGNKWSDFQITRYKNNAQPYYIVLDDKGEDISKPVGYTPDVEEYKAWLDQGLAKFNK